MQWRRVCLAGCSNCRDLRERASRERPPSTSRRSRPTPCERIAGGARNRTPCDGMRRDDRRHATPADQGTTPGPVKRGNSRRGTDPPHSARRDLALARRTGYPASGDADFGRGDRAVPVRGPTAAFVPHARRVALDTTRPVRLAVLGGARRVDPAGGPGLRLSEHDRRRFRHPRSDRRRARGGAVVVPSAQVGT